MNQIPFGLDIGATTIKAVWLSHEKDNYKLLAASLLPTPPRGLTSDAPLDLQEMAQAIRTIVSEAKITTKLLNVALPENQVYSRILDMPVLSDKELSSAILYEAEQYIPVPLETMTLDWKVLRRPDAHEINGKMQVLLVGAPTKLIQRYEKIMQMTGLTINAIETEIISSVRVLVRDANFPNSVIINIGAVSTSLGVVRNGIIVFTYTIPTGGVAINRAIASDFGFSMAQAEEYKKTYGVVEKSFGGKIGKATEPILSTIVNEVKKALTLYSEKYQDSPIAQVLLSGGSSKLPGLDLFFAKNCGIETVTANPWKILGSQEVPKEILDNATGYTVAVGLAMRDDE